MIHRLLDLGRAVRRALVHALHGADGQELATPARDGEGDTIFGLDVVAEQVLLAGCEELGATLPFTLVAEGLEPEGRRFGHGTPTHRLIVDPIDGTRPLMCDKRSGWFLAALAPERGAGTTLAQTTHAVMLELPTTRQTRVEELWAVRGAGAGRLRTDLATGQVLARPLAPATATDLRYGFATVVSYFPGGKELIARLDEALMTRVLGPWNPHKAEVFADHAISSGAQLAELALGRDRLVLDVRPLVHRALGAESSLCSKPYDLCTALVAQEAGCVVTAPDGAPLDPPLDVTTNVAFVGYANRDLAARIQPVLTALLREHRLV